MTKSINIEVFNGASIPEKLPPTQGNQLYGYHKETLNSVAFHKDENAKTIVGSNYGQLINHRNWCIKLSEGYNDVLKDYTPKYKDHLPDQYLAIKSNLA